MTRNPQILIVGGYGIVGEQICALLAARNPDIHLLIGGRTGAKAKAAADAYPNAAGVIIDVADDDPLAGLSSTPDAIIVAVNDHHDRLLLSAARRGIALIDIARWQQRQDDANRKLAAIDLKAPILLSSGWMAGVAAIVAAAKRQSTAPAKRVEINVLFATKDRAGPDSVVGFVDMHKAFEIHEDGRKRVVRGLSDPKKVRFFGGKVAQVRRISCPDQTTLVANKIADNVAARLAFDDAMMTAAFAWLARSGIWSLIPVAMRRKLLHNPGSGAAHEFVVEIVEAHGRTKVLVRDPLGQTHMTAASAVNQAERVLGLCGRQPVPPGISYPEQSSDLPADIAALQQMGVEILRDWA